MSFGEFDLADEATRKMWQEMSWRSGLAGSARELASLVDELTSLIGETSDVPVGRVRIVERGTLS